SWTKDYAELVAQTSGILLLVHAEQRYTPTSILDIDECNRDTNQELVEKVFEIDEAPGQVKLVDILQCVMEYSDRPKPLKIGVIVSAWDVIEALAPYRGEQSPEQFLEQNVSLLYQYLGANPELFEVAVFGISALGGNLDSDICLLQTVRPQSHR